MTTPEARPMMLAGPVCHFELVRIARRGRTFAWRLAFGLLVLGIIGAQYAGHSTRWQILHGSDELTLSELAEFGQALFVSIMAAQAALVLGLTPALVADAIASEWQRKTLHYLLASRLTSGAIVLGKLAARLVSVGVFPALVLPIMSLLTLIGGVSPEGLVVGYAVIASTAYFLGGLSLWASVIARRPREAVGLAYALTAAWLFLPPAVNLALLALPNPAPAIAAAARPAAEWAWPASPLALVTQAGSVLGGGSGALWRFAAWMLASQATYGSLFVALAAWRLRPSFRRHEGQAERPSRVARVARRWFPLRPCGDDPILWKEAYFSAVTGGLGRKLVRLAALVALALTVGGMLFASREAFLELWQNGYRYSSSGYDKRMELNLALRYVGALVFGVWVLWLAGASSASLSSEHEQDTWISLLATPLDGREILRGKMLGPLRATAPFGLALGALWLIGLAAGAVHPLGLFNAAVLAAILAWFAIALGTFASSKTKVTWRARAWAQAILVAPHFCCLIPAMLYLLGISLWSYTEISELPNVEVRDLMSWSAFLAGAYYFGGTALYAGLAWAMTADLFGGFDAAAGRPRRRPGNAADRPAPKPAPAKESVGGGDELSPDL